MANIRKELGRHDWRPQILPQFCDPWAGGDRKAVKLLCWNCRKPWDEKTMGSPPVDGCLTDIKVRNLGRERQRDYTQQENRLLAEAREREKRQDAYDLAKAEEFLREKMKRHLG